MLTELCGLFVDYCNFYWLFGLSLWRHLFTADDPLVSSATFLQNCSDEENKDLGWLEGEYIFSKYPIVGWTIPLKK